MPTPREHKTVQARILKYAETIGWTLVSRSEAGQLRGFDSEVPPNDQFFFVRTLFNKLMPAKTRVHEHGLPDRTS